MTIKPDKTRRRSRALAPCTNQSLIIAWAAMGALLALLVTAPAFADTGALPPATLEGRSSLPLGPYLDVMLDPDARLTIQDVSQPPASHKFARFKGMIPNYGISPAALWARVALKNPQDKPGKYYLVFDYPVTDSVSVYIPEERGGFTRLDAGDAVRNSPGLVPDRLFVFPLRLEAGAEKTIYVRVKTTASLTLPLMLWKPEAFQRHDHLDQFLYGLLFGAVILFAVYFSAVSFSLRNAACRWFSFYLTMFGLLVALRKGFIQEFIGQEGVAFNGLINIVVIGLLYFTGAKLLRTFLDTRGRNRKIDRGLQVLQWLGLAFIPASLFPSPLTPIVSIVLIGFGPLFSTSVAIVYWFKGLPDARYFALGWLAGHLTSLVDYLRIIGLMPYYPFMDYLLPLSLGLVMLFFGLAIIQQTSTYRYFSTQDVLTGLANRWHFDRQMALEWNRNMRHRRPISLLMVDVDHFKDYNDHYGHAAGDECLKAIAGILNSFSRRPGDLVARYGGEEFVVMLSETQPETAAGMAEAMRTAIEKKRIPHGGTGDRAVVTASFGVASAVPETGRSPAELLEQADKALYNAKRGGRNKVAVHSAGTNKEGKPFGRLSSAGGG